MMTSVEDSHASPLETPNPSFYPEITRAVMESFGG
jgi:hypothetical protein